MKLMHNISDCAIGTNTPASNFIYDFYSYKFLVSDDWTVVFAHDEEGNVTYGSSRALEEASAAGCDIKVGISGICEGVFGKEHTIKHELFMKNEEFLKLQVCVFRF